MPTDTKQNDTQVDEKGNIQFRRFPTYNRAREAFKKLIENADEVSWMRAMIQGLIDGNPPYADADLKRYGQGWRSNVNFREAEAVIDKNAASYWELLIEVPTLINCKIKKTKGNKNVSPDIGKIIAEEFTQTLHEWDDFAFHLQTFCKEMLKFGYGPTYYPNRWDWRFDVAKSSQVLFPASSKCTSPNTVYIRGIMEIDELWNQVIDSDSTDGWNLEIVKKALLVCIYQGDNRWNSEKYQSSDWEDLQQKIRNNDFDINEKEYDPLNIVHVFTLNRDGTISHAIMTEVDTISGYLYENESEYESLTQAMCLFFYNIGDEYIRSVKGLGHRIFAHMETSNRLLNSTADAGFLSSSIILQESSGVSNDTPSLVKVGPIVVIPKGYAAQQSTFSPQMNGLIQLRYMFQQLMNNNVGMFKPNMEMPDAPEKSATEASLQHQAEVSFNNDQVAMFYVQWKKLLKEIFRRLTGVARNEYPEDAPGYEMAKDFVDRCKERGVDKKFLSLDKMVITPTRAIGLGSPGLKRMTMDKTYAQRASLPEAGRAQITRDWFATYLGYSQADEYMPLGTNTPSEEMALAVMEENDMSEGKATMVTADQWHRDHMGVHVQKRKMLLDAILQNQQADPMKLAAYLTAGVNHDKNHIAFMEQDESLNSDAKQWAGFTKMVEQALTKLNKQIEKAMMQQQQKQQEMAAQPRVDPETQKKAMEAEFKKQIDTFKAESAAALKKQKADFDQMLKTKKLDADIAREDKKADADINRKTRQQ